MRPTDASTLVLIDPSEVSTVGDITHEEMQYGLVVDQIPPPRPHLLLSAAGSMIVEATKSECPEDLEDDDLDEEGQTVPGDGNVAPRNVAAAAAAAAPQNQESNVVDHVPENESSPLKDVDLPTGSERGIGLDSVAALKSVGSEDDDSLDETDNVRFGPVVDHLPVVIPVSRGGSTTGVLATLATLSEAGYDETTNGGEDGWGSDDRGLSDGGDLTTKNRSAPCRTS